MLVTLTAAELVRYTAWVVFVAIGLWTVGLALRWPTAVHIDTALLFGCLTAAIVVNLLVQLKLIPSLELTQIFIALVLIALPFLLVRLMNDIVGVPRSALLIASAVFVLCALLVVVLLLAPDRAPAGLTLVIVAGLVGMLIYVVFVGVRAIRSFQGITRRRLIAATLGTLFLALNFSASSLRFILPLSAEDVRSLVDLSGLAAGICYLVGFAPPRWLRRVWQGPELRNYLQRASRLALVDDLVSVLAQLEQGAAAAFGAYGASIGLWDDNARALCFSTLDPPVWLTEVDDMPVIRAFKSQEALFSQNTSYTQAADAALAYRHIAKAVLAAPISAGEQRLGVLAVYAPRAPVFAAEDLSLIQLLADQVAVTLEVRRLNEGAAQVRAREEAARLKEDFLSTAAHDLKTPLTSIILQSQQLARRARRNPDAPVDPAGLERLVRESEHLRGLVRDLLDAARAEHGSLVSERTPFDLVAAVNGTLERHASARHRFLLNMPDSLISTCDPLRIGQVLDNLIENAVKYSPDGGTIAIQLWQDDEGVHLTVRDQGIGIPAADLPQLFERFHRGTNVDHRRFPGWGLGLSICRQIIEQHGGQIGVDSRVGAGTTFHVSLPGAGRG